MCASISTPVYLHIYIYIYTTKKAVPQNTKQQLKVLVLQLQSTDHVEELSDVFGVLFSLVFEIWFLLDYYKGYYQGTVLGRGSLFPGFLSFLGSGALGFGHCGLGLLGGDSESDATRILGIKIVRFWRLRGFGTWEPRDAVGLLGGCQCRVVAKTSRSRRWTWFWFRA